MKIQRWICLANATHKSSVAPGHRPINTRHGALTDHQDHPKERTTVSYDREAYLQKLQGLSQEELEDELLELMKHPATAKAVRKYLKQQRRAADLSDED